VDQTVREGDNSVRVVGRKYVLQTLRRTTPTVLKVAIALVEDLRILIDDRKAMIVVQEAATADRAALLANRREVIRADEMRHDGKVLSRDSEALVVAANAADVLHMVRANVDGSARRHAVGPPSRPAAVADEALAVSSVRTSDGWERTAEAAAEVEAPEEGNTLWSATVRNSVHHCTDLLTALHLLRNVPEERLWSLLAFTSSAMGNANSKLRTKVVDFAIHHHMNVSK
jgi:hypothetical protein